MDEAETVELLEIISEDFALPWLGNDVLLTEERIRLYDEDFKISQKVEIGVEALKHAHTVRGLRGKAYDAVKNLHKKMKKVALYSRLELGDEIVSRFIMSNEMRNNTKEVNVYSRACLSSAQDKWFVSLDMVEAGFTSLRLVSPDLTFGENTWEGMMGHATKYKYIQSAPVIRHKALGVGLAKPVCQRGVMKYICEELRCKLNGSRGASDSMSGGGDPDKPQWIMVTADEIGMFFGVDIMEEDRAGSERIFDDIRESVLSQVQGVLTKYNDSTFKLERRFRFTVSKIRLLEASYLDAKGSKRHVGDLYVRSTVYSSLLDGSDDEDERPKRMIKIKAADPALIPQATRFVKTGKNDVDSDLVFTHGPHVAKLLSPCVFDWVKLP